ncbi:MAG TPA: prephenate dehydratase [Solirubrobacteraceae bacterium]|jgi:prephenate dehydratase
MTTPNPLPRAGYLGPEGTFSEEALLGSVDPTAVQPVPIATIRDAVMAVQNGVVEWALAPIENSIEGSVTVTLDTLAGEATDVAIVGEVVLPVRHYLVAPTPLPLDAVTTIVSHPHVPGQCTRFLHDRVPQARIVAASSTAEAARLVVERKEPGLAAICTQLACELYGCTVIAPEIQDRADNATRFVWLAREKSPLHGPPLISLPGPDRKTSLVFWGPGADRAGWLVRCLNEFGSRDINLTKIESRPMRERLGHYMFFLDLQGSDTDTRVSDALAGLRGMCERVRVFGSYPTA